MKLNLRSWLFFISVAAGIAMADQIVKAIVEARIGPGNTQHERWFAGHWLGLSYAENTGIAFGLLRGGSPLALAVAAIAILSLIVWLVATHRDSMLVWTSGALIAGGATGNLIDRIRLEHVRDFLSVGPWPQFNVADAAITIGVLVALFATLTEHQPAVQGAVRRGSWVGHPNVAADRSER